MTDREMLESALQRVNAKLGAKGKLYNDNTGWFVSWKGLSLSESSMCTGELLAYLHGVEDLHIHLVNSLDSASDASEDVKKELLYRFVNLLTKNEE